MSTTEEVSHENDQLKNLHQVSSLLEVVILGGIRQAVTVQGDQTQAIGREIIMC
jgi:hypothetical protein